MGISLRVIAIILALASAVSPAMADSFLSQMSRTPDENFDNYVALDVGQTSATTVCSSPSTTGCRNTAALYRVALGGQITPMWGAEVSYAKLGHASAGNFGSIPIDWLANAIQISGTGSYPLGNSFSLIGKLELVHAYDKVSGGGASASGTSTSLGLGIGAQYNFTNTVAVRAQYENLGVLGNPNTHTNTNFSLLSIGIVLGYGY